MAVARSNKVFLGTDETTGVTVTSGTTSTSSEVDMLGDDISMGQANFYFKYTSTSTSGAITYKLQYSRISGQPYPDQPAIASVSKSITPVNGTEKIFIGTFIVSRYMVVSITKAAGGADLTNTLVAAEVFKMS